MLVFHLKLSGAILICLGLTHGTFGRFLNWKNDLAQLSVVNRQIFYVHCFFIALFLILSGGFLILFANSLVAPDPLSRAILGAMAVVWAARLFVQWFVFDRALWQGNRIRQVAHYLLTGLWLYLLCVDGTALAQVW